MSRNLILIIFVSEIEVFYSYKKLAVHILRIKIFQFVPNRSISLCSYNFKANCLETPINRKYSRLCL